jgi:hypothetical protein
MPSDLVSNSVYMELFLSVALAIATAIARRSASIHRSIDEVAATTQGARPQWMAILAANLGANAGYFALIGAYLLFGAPEDPAEMPGYWVLSAVVAYASCGLPIYLGVGIVPGLLGSRYSRRNSVPIPANAALYLAGSAAAGGLPSISIYFFGLMAGAL